MRPTFVPSVRFVRQMILQTSSCQIIVQKSAIVFGFGPNEKLPISTTKNNTITEFYENG